MNLAESDPELAELVLLQVTTDFTLDFYSFSLLINLSRAILTSRLPR